MQEIHNYSNGLPSEACVLADNALGIAFINNIREVNEEVARAAAQDRLKNVGSLDNKPVARAQVKEEVKTSENGGAEK